MKNANMLNRAKAWMVNKVTRRFGNATALPTLGRVIQELASQMPQPSPSAGPRLDAFLKEMSDDDADVLYQFMDGIAIKKIARRTGTSADAVGEKLERIWTEVEKLVFPTEESGGSEIHTP